MLLWNQVYTMNCSSYLLFKHGLRKSVWKFTPITNWIERHQKVDKNFSLGASWMIFWCDSIFFFYFPYSDGCNWLPLKLKTICIYEASNWNLINWATPFFCLHLLCGGYLNYLVRTLLRTSCIILQLSVL